MKKDFVMRDDSAENESFVVEKYFAENEDFAMRNDSAVVEKELVGYNYN